MGTIPILNKTYNVFDDGKFSESRRYEVIVKEIIPFNEIDSNTLKQWQYEVKTSYWLYSAQTDYFIKTLNEDSEVEVFAKTKDGGWFSMGFMTSGRLDIDGKLNKRLSA